MPSIRDFSLHAVYEAMDAQRVARQLTWAAATRQMNGGGKGRHPLAQSTIVGLEHKRIAEGDGVLAMLLWLDRTPESFVPGLPGADAERFRLRQPAPGQVLRWDTKALYAALDDRRHDCALTWAGLAREVGGFTPGMLAHLSKGPRTAFPQVMRLVQWLEQPAASFTRLADH